ncbi:DUF2235 domain-containing protein [Haloferula helveola]|uniref:DUF2235 domain-containing protein n=1 Tax=Haloferula helveola TaxID=490095 RepID=A0ABM7RCV7_9BACT|nr:DUF2235 domain-containing protein [Haloferula helveola]
MALYAFDGTWNDSSAPDGERDWRKDTNVHRFRSVYADGKPPGVHYLDGVGSRGGLLGKYIGGITGLGAEARIREQWDNLVANFKSGDTTIDIVGYSRGAAIARMFVHRIEETFEGLQLNGTPLTSAPTVRFLGLFDTVASFGVPWTADEGDFRPDIPEFVENTFHAMALDETRETFGIERCLGNRKKITEVWFRGGHGDIGGNATYAGRHDTESNRLRSDIALRWMLAKARACGLPVAKVGDGEIDGDPDEAPVTAKEGKISIGNAGTHSRRIHLGDLVHHSLERIELTRGLDGRLLRRIAVPTRVEDEELEASAEALHWVPTEEPEMPGRPSGPSLVELSSRRYPFDVPPARRWKAWLKRWGFEKVPEIDGESFDDERLDLFWSPSPADRELAWDLIVELKTRITTQKMKDEDGDDATALESYYKLFPHSREFFHRHGRSCSNSATLISFFLNKHVRPFTGSWHPRVLKGELDGPDAVHTEFRKEMEEVRLKMLELVEALEDLADIRL